MRLGVGVTLDAAGLSDVPAIARAVEAAGLDVLWWTPTGGEWTASLLVAAASAFVTASVLVVQDVSLCGLHPLPLVEERHVTDRLLGGRLVTVLRGDADEQAEVAELLLVAATGRPFRHEGTRWTIPGGLATNTHNLENRIRVTPAPVGPTAQVWVGSSDSGTGLPVVDSSGTWSRLDRDGTSAERAAPRPAIREWDPTTESGSAVAARLHDERRSTGLDLVAVRIAAPPLTPAWVRAVSALAHSVRPRVQLDRLPSGLTDFWDETLGEGTQSDEHIEMKEKI